ncbi:putative late blight resistance protein homolog R1A-4 isoform X1 [Coffea arabica]|uniref:Late blight resistance protein homolog R1A-4 isoform X1 n=1 Tax=Coffea arabica TaxID=13443 RepID=A0A6P6V436_COFAR
MEFFGKLVKSTIQKAVQSVNRTSTDVFDSLCEELYQLEQRYYDRDRDAADQIRILEIEAGLMRMFQMLVTNWDDADKQRGAGQGLGSVVRDLEVAFKKAMNDVRIAAREEVIVVAISKLELKHMCSSPQVEAAYEYVASNYSLRSHDFLSNYDNWYNFFNCLRIIVWRQIDLLSHICPQFGTMYDMLECLGTYVEKMRYSCPNLQIKLRTHFGGALVRTAHFSYLCWIHRMHEDKKRQMIIMLSDLLKAFKPNTPQVTELCIKLTSDHCSCHSEPYAYVYLVEKFIGFLIPKECSRLQTFCKRLKDLVFFARSIYVSDLYRADDVKLTLMEIKATIIELGSFGYSVHDREETWDTDPAFFRLVEKMELLRVEVFLIRLLNQKGSLKFLERQIDSFHNELEYFRDYQRNAPVAKTKVPKLIWLHIRPVAGEAGSVYRSFLAKSITEDKFTDELLKLLEKIKLLKTEVLFEELLSRHPSLTDNVKRQINSLGHWLVVSRTYLMGPLEENEKSILTQVESVARDAACFYYSLLENEITEETMREFSHLLPELVDKMKVVNAEIKEIYLPHRRSLRSNFPKMEGLGSIDFFLVDLLEQLKSKAGSVLSVKHKFHVVHREIKFLRSFLTNIEEKYDKHQDLKSVASSIVQVTLEAEYLIDSFVAGDSLRWYHPLWLSDIVEDLKLIKLQARKTCKNAHGINIHNVPTASTMVSSQAEIRKIDEVVIDLADEKKLFIDRLIAGSGKLGVFSVVGMAGLGKTTLARRVYDDPSVTDHFHVQAWCCISQTYQKRELLLQILRNIVELTDDVLEMSDEDLVMKLYQCLKSYRYLVVMDDMWSIEAWNDFKISFPNDNNGSRILITTRHSDVAAEVQVDGTPHPLRLLSDDESWELLQKKLFDTKECPIELMVVGKQIAESCKGLPLAVVAIAGLLEKTDMIPDRWKQVSESICSQIADDPERRCMDILELSYRYLPNYLKPCFLYIAVFLEDKDIPVRKLAWLWRAEGFITDSGVESIEDIAEGYLRNLIGRSLVMPSKRRSRGGMKTCRVHDMLRTLCIRKSEEENLLQFQNGYDELFDSSHEDIDYGVDPNYIYPKNTIKYQKRRLSIFSKRHHFTMSRPSGPFVRTLLYSATSDMYPRCPYDISFIFDNFELLRVLDLECINMGNSFPTGVLVLVGLRFLALCGDIDSIPASINYLRNLETLLVKGLKGKVSLPYAIWSMEKLRHLHIKNYAVITLEDGESTVFTPILNLVSLSSPYLFCGKGTENIMRRLLKLRKMRCLFSELPDDTGKCNQFPILNFLTELESLNVLYSGRIALSCNFDFPLNLRKLTVSKFRLPWDCISEIGRLPNLEVLKLLSKAFEGKVWEMKEGEFLKLKFLKLDSLNIAEWNACSDHLPQLVHLILRSCRELKEVPSGFGDSSTLEMIEVQFCTSSLVESVRQLQQEQLDMGNELKVIVDRSDLDF